MEFLPEISRIIDYGLSGDSKKLASQVQLLIKQLLKKGDSRSAEALSKKLSFAEQNIKPNSSQFERPIPVEKDNRFPLADFKYFDEGETWIALPEHVQSNIQLFLSYLKHKQKLKAENIPLNPTMLLYGPPGTGKSKLAAYIASKLNLPLITARSDALISSYLGSTSKNIRMLMDYAQAQPCVLFLDEFDALAKGRDDSNEIGELKRVVVSLLQNIDSLDNVILIAATNHSDLLDKAVWRRFQYKIEIMMPTENIREKIIQHIIPNIDKKNLALLLELSDGLSGADIEAITYEYQRERILTDNNISINKLFQLALIAQNNHLTFLKQDMKDEIIYIRTKFNLSYEKLATIFNISKTYVGKILKESD